MGRERLTVQCYWRQCVSMYYSDSRRKSHTSSKGLKTMASSGALAGDEADNLEPASVLAAQHGMRALQSQDGSDEVSELEQKAGVCIRALCIAPS